MTKPNDNLIEAMLEALELTADALNDSFGGVDTLPARHPARIAVEAAKAAIARAIGS